MVGFLRSKFVVEHTAAHVLKRSSEWQRAKRSRALSDSIDDLVEEFFADPTPRLIYQLVNTGYDIQRLNSEGENFLTQCLRRFPTMASLYHALFQCGAEFEIKPRKSDTHQLTCVEDLNDLRLHSSDCAELSEHVDWNNVFASSPMLSEDVRKVVQTYYPGLWRAVLSKDFALVKRLIDMWCRVDIQRNGYSLLELAVQSGVEQIIDMLTVMSDSLRVVHAVLAGDNQLVKHLLKASMMTTNNVVAATETTIEEAAATAAVANEFQHNKISTIAYDETADSDSIVINYSSSHSAQMSPSIMSSTTMSSNTRISISSSRPHHNVDINLRNMNFMGATPLYYAIANGNVGLVALLVEAGADLTALLALPNATEIPVLFCALSFASSHPNLLEVLLYRARCKKAIAQLLYRSDTLLHFAMSQSINSDQLRLLLRCCSAKVIAQRNEFNQLAYDMCSQEHQLEFDRHLRLQIVANDHKFLLDLVANGYDRMWDELADAVSLSPERARLYNGFREHIEAFVLAVENGDVDGVRDRTLFHADIGNICVVNCRRQGDGQPPLHKAVLRRHVPLCHYLCHVVCHLLHMPLDNVRDHHRRSALCYAFAMGEVGAQIAQLLTKYGASESTLDKDNRSPLNFKERCTHPQIDHFLLYHLQVDFNHLEPDLWSETNSSITVSARNSVVMRSNYPRQRYNRQSLNAHALQSDLPDEDEIKNAINRENHKSTVIIRQSCVIL